MKPGAWFGVWRGPVIVAAQSTTIELSDGRIIRTTSRCDQPFVPTARTG